MRWRSSLSVILLSFSLAGCSETAVIRSGPTGADVYVNDQLVGRTPVQYLVPRDRLEQAFQVRIEKQGYEPVATSLHTQLARGRVTGAVFTLGILAIFRSMYFIEPIFVQLEAVPSPQEERDRQLGESLRNLRALHDTGQISDQEYRRRQEELLQAK